MEPDLPSEKFRHRIKRAWSSEAVRSIEVANFGGYDNITVTSGPRIDLFSHEIRIIVKACGVNFNDIYAWQGLYVYGDVKPPFTMGMECSGIVEEVGNNVKDFKVGDRVMCWNFNYGLWTENLCVPSANCFKMPNSMTYEEAAGFPVSYVAAYFAVMEYSNLRSGQVLYVQTAGGGFGCAAIQLAKTIDDITIIGCSSPSKHKILFNQGLKYCFDSSSNETEREIQAYYPEGIDVILCNIVGSKVDRNRQLLKPFGRFVHVGAVNLPKGDKKNLIHILKLIWQRRSVSPVELMHYNRCECGFSLAMLFDKNPELFKSALEKLMILYEKRLVSPIIDSVWPFSQVGKAISRILNRENIGKVILVTEETSSGDKEDDTMMKIQGYKEEDDTMMKTQGYKEDDTMMKTQG